MHKLQPLTIIVLLWKYQVPGHEKWKKLQSLILSFKNYRIQTFSDIKWFNELYGYRSQIINKIKTLHY